MKMPFGKHEGQELTDVPDDYLSWMSGNLRLREPLRSAVARELRSRQGGYTSYSQPARLAINLGTDDLPLLRQIIDTGYRALAKVHHPDIGGTTGQMERLNHVVASIRDQLSAVAR